MRTVQDGDYIFAPEYVNLTERVQEGIWIGSGGAPTANGVGLKTDIAVGTIINQGVSTALAAITLTHDAEAVLTIRYDVISTTTAGVASITKGTAEATAPDLPANESLIAIVRIGNGETTLTNADIYDARVIKSYYPKIIANTTINCPQGSFCDITVTSLGGPVELVWYTNTTVAFDISVTHLGTGTGLQHTFRLTRNDVVATDVTVTYKVIEW